MIFLSFLWSLTNFVRFSTQDFCLLYYLSFFNLLGFFSNASLLMDVVILVYHIFSCISFIYQSFDNYNLLLISSLLHFTTQFLKALLFHKFLNDFICFEVYNSLLIFIMEGQSKPTPFLQQ